MNILMIGPFPKPIHGMSIANENLFNCLSNDNINVDKIDTVIHRVLKSKKEQGGFNFSFFILSLWNMFLIIKKILFSKYEIIYITPGQSALGFLRFLPIILISKLKKNKVIQHIHGSKLIYNYKNTNFIFKFLFIFSIKLTDNFILLSNKIKEEYKEIIPLSKISICLNGVKIPKNITHSNEGKKTNVLFLSNLMKDKGIIDLFETINNFPFNNNYVFHFAGEIESSLKDYCYSFFRKNKDTCTYHGIVSGDKKEFLLSSADIFILPSYDEGIPLSILEAYSYSCAVITTNVGGIPDIFEDQINGLYIEIGNTDSIYQALIKARENIKHFKINNQNLSVSKYSLSIFYETMKNIFYKVI
ncbi:glycosyltransferase family 4 protein [Proteus cibarius]|uniref:glycosyltransferase family 4 protein n=1 Tax=Proteus terrae TaxID=1574161 RepID=UPI00131F5D75|nr:glycosyltransferase family 4 protein [Proteus terrae]MBG6039396.1 glycosyltransferase family 4 protein [Proteus terrae subsp. cibarius]MCW9690190.1 glycosyltransferase family 4 protein [Proteus terrae]MDR9743599.1 glycosyltransferase family 4 protein [Proteus terrae]QHD94173.1 glycosyltransferase [Proteus terrae subsp. cibarius]QJW49441.1 glycosyltransferase family 4 protein [Proteus terrae subsp. cibarius]